MPEASPAQGWVGSLEGTWPESPSVGSGEARAFAPGPAGCARPLGHSLHWRQRDQGPRRPTQMILSLLPCTSGCLAPCPAGPTFLEPVPRPLASQGGPGRALVTAWSLECVLKGFDCRGKALSCVRSTG